MDEPLRAEDALRRFGCFAFGGRATVRLVEATLAGEFPELAGVLGTPLRYTVYRWCSRGPCAWASKQTALCTHDVRLDSCVTWIECGGSNVKFAISRDNAEAGRWQREWFRQVVRSCDLAVGAPLATKGGVAFTRAVAHLRLAESWLSVWVGSTRADSVVETEEAPPLSVLRFEREVHVRLVETRTMILVDDMRVVRWLRDMGVGPKNSWYRVPPGQVAAMLAIMLADWAPQLKPCATILLKMYAADVMPNLTLTAQPNSGFGVAHNVSYACDAIHVHELGLTWVSSTNLDTKPTCVEPGTSAFGKAAKYALSPEARSRNDFLDADDAGLTTLGLIRCDDDDATDTADWTKR